MKFLDVLGKTLIVIAGILSIAIGTVLIALGSEGDVSITKVIWSLVGVVSVSIGAAAIVDVLIVQRIKR